MYIKNFQAEDFVFDIDEVLKTAWEAGRAIMDIYEKDFEVEFKKDESPLTVADKTAHEIIQKNLEKYNLPILSEEGKNIPYEERKNWNLFWMVDPLDGTKEFIKKNGEFTVNIALIDKNKPVFGVVYAPAINEIYFTDSENAYKAELSVDEFKLKNIKKLPLEKKKEKYVIVASKSHLNDETKNFIDNIKTDKEKEFISKGSSLKLCMVAEGIADIYPRIAPTMEWDTAAADAIVREVGKMTYIYDEGIWSKVLDNNTQYPKSNTHDQTPNTQHPKPIIYNKENLLNPWFIVR